MVPSSTRTAYATGCDAPPLTTSSMPATSRSASTLRTASSMLLPSGRNDRWIVGRSISIEPRSRRSASSFQGARSMVIRSAVSNELPAASFTSTRDSVGGLNQLSDASPTVTTRSSPGIAAERRESRSGVLAISSGSNPIAAIESTSKTNSRRRIPPVRSALGTGRGRPRQPRSVACFLFMRRILGRSTPRA